MENLRVYYWDLCPHCHKMLEFLREKQIPFEALDIEKQPDDIVKKVIDANGGDDWVVPTLEYRGEWIPGQVFDEFRVTRELEKWKLLP